MAVQLTKKETVLRTRASKRRHSLKVSPVAKGVKKSQEEQNRAVIAKIEAKLKK